MTTVRDIIREKEVMSGLSRQMPMCMKPCR